MYLTSHLSRCHLFLFLFTMLLLPLSTEAADPKFRRPLNTVKTPAFSAYYDHDTGPGAKTYYCGTDTVYHDHKGTDFRADIGTPVYAAATGGLYHWYNNCDTYGYFGSQCGGGFGNHVRIDHEGNLTDGIGWVSIYAHMKYNTASGVSSVYCGSKIGETGSSGNSTGPHLHFEVRKYSYPNNDPFSGPCSGSTSFWVNQSNGVPLAQCQS